MWQNLIQTLKELSDAYAALLGISGKKRAALVAVDLKGLEPIVEEEKQQLERIRVAEKRRQDALLALSGKIPSIHAATPIAQKGMEVSKTDKDFIKGAHKFLQTMWNAGDLTGQQKEMEYLRLASVPQYRLCSTPHFLQKTVHLFSLPYP